MNMICDRPGGAGTAVLEFKPQLRQGIPPWDPNRQPGPEFDGPDQGDNRGPPLFIVVIVAAALIVGGFFLNRQVAALQDCPRTNGQACNGQIAAVPHFSPSPVAKQLP